MCWQPIDAHGGAVMEGALSSLDFFRQMHAHYGQLIERVKGRSMLLDAVLQLAWAASMAMWPRSAKACPIWTATRAAPPAAPCA
jgi:hypothetical protein